MDIATKENQIKKIYNENLQRESTCVSPFNRNYKTTQSSGKPDAAPPERID